MCPQSFKYLRIYSCSMRLSEMDLSILDSSVGLGSRTDPLRRGVVHESVRHCTPHRQNDWAYDILSHTHYACLYIASRYFDQTPGRLPEPPRSQISAARAKDPVDPRVRAADAVDPRVQQVV